MGELNINYKVSLGKYFGGNIFKDSYRKKKFFLIQLEKLVRIYKWKINFFLKEEEKYYII